MKFVIIDNSLCVNTLVDDVNPRYLENYIEALADAGVKYMEIDFRTAMLSDNLPKSMKYIFRLLDPMFLDIADAFNFDYLLVTLSNLKNPLKTDVPVMLELPATEKPPRPAVIYAADRIDGTISLLRLVSSFRMMEPEEAEKYVLTLKNNVPIPIDVCPMNDVRTALDSAFKLSVGGADSVTMTMGLSERYASIEEFMLTMVSVYHTIPENFNIPALCRAMVYHKLIFKNSKGDTFNKLMDRLNRDISGLVNADTGNRVRTGIMLRDSQMLRKQFVSAFEKMADDSDIPEEIAEQIMEAVRHFDAGFYDPSMMNKMNKNLLN